MATPSPGHRLRKTTDFFRAGGSRSRTGGADEPVPSPPTFLSEPESPVRKRSTRIPFLGRQRKKSTQSDASTSASSAGPSSRQSDSDVRNSSASRLVPDVPVVEVSERPLQSHPSKSPTSLGSKFAARFTPSRQKLTSVSPQKLSRPSTDESASVALVPSPSRATSVDSGSSENRSTTPRPNQPTITVSLPPDNIDGYEDMFTLPRSNSPIEDPQRTPTMATSSIDPVHFPTPQSSGSTADTMVKHRGSRSDERPSSRGSRTSRKPVLGKELDIDSTDAEDSEAVMSDSPKPSPPMHSGLTPISEKRRTLATMPYTFEKTIPKSIMKPTSELPHRPPGFPLPPPPTNPPSSALPTIPPSLSRRPSTNPPVGIPSRRQRAQTLSSVPHSPSGTSPQSPLLATVPPRRIIKSIGEKSALASLPANKVTDEPSAPDKENFDMEKASPDQLRQALTVRNQKLDELRQALTLRNQQFDELASYLLKITDSHVNEKRALLKKLASLETEATRREKEIQGLRWLVTNNTRPGGSGSLGILFSAAPKSMSELEGRGKISPSNPAEDSGAESHQTTSGAEESHRESGAESPWGSGTSAGESSSSSSGRKVKRTNNLMHSFYRTSARSAGSDGDPPSPLLSYASSPNTKRSSISSVATSPSSSTSSLSLSTVTPATTVMSLSAIPEALPPAPFARDPVVAAAILATENQRAKEERRAEEEQREKDERRANRASNRMSASSNSSGASAAYAANLKRSRPPSIAQVLASSPKMENGRDKLRSYGTSGSASS